MEKAVGFVSSPWTRILNVLNFAAAIDNVRTSFCKPFTVAIAINKDKLVAQNLVMEAMLKPVLVN
jgi:fumarate reductase subunit C